MPFISLTTLFAVVIILSFAVHSLISNRGVRYLNYLFGLFLLARFGQLLVFLLIDNELIVHVPVLLKLFCPLYYVAPSFVYLYTTGFVNNRTHLRKIDYLHFLPGIIAFVDDIPWYFSPAIHWDTIALELAETKDISVVAETGIFPAEVYLFVRPLMLTIYLILAFRVLFKSEMYRYGTGTKRLWMLSCLIGVAVFHILNIFAVYFRNNGLLFDEDSQINLWLFGTGLTLFLAMLLFLIHHPRILYGYILVEVGERNKIVELQGGRESVKSVSLNSEADLELIQSIKNYMIHEKPFLNSDFQILDLAHYFKIPTHQCSAMINQLIGKNFRDWINSHRVDYFIKTYPQKSLKLTIDAIAFESGFSSMTTFYRAFKKETGTMPSNYFQD